ncbi:MAG TPA: 5-carboxymethyl-2-hydroxymuconate isomerase [Anaerolineae bacterium]|nr:5-carboxymethyl-2-hydroxymuconate isomerase [Anaerolineae bacterium]
MKLVTYEYHGRTQIGAVENNEIINLSPIASDMLAFIALGAAGLAEAAALIADGGERVALDETRLLAPIPTPRRNVMCLGLNYAAHAVESLRAKGEALATAAVPIVFTKASTAVTGPYDDILLDTAVTQQLDWEIELAVIIGREDKNIPVEEAMSYVYGYTVLNDISARDLQLAGKQFFKGKSLDGSCPLGPVIVTADELDPADLQVTCRVNGALKQDGRTSQMIFDIPATIAYLSLGMTLLPGDIIATGTPEGVGFARTPPEFLQPGDVVACKIEGIGEIRNRIVDASSLSEKSE